jgi:hypothetical protein
LIHLILLFDCQVYQQFLQQGIKSSSAFFIIMTVRDNAVELVLSLEQAILSCSLRLTVVLYIENNFASSEKVWAISGVTVPVTFTCILSNAISSSALCIFFYSWLSLSWITSRLPPFECLLRYKLVAWIAMETPLWHSGKATSIREREGMSVFVSLHDLLPVKCRPRIWLRVRSARL